MTRTRRATAWPNGARPGPTRAAVAVLLVIALVVAVLVWRGSQDDRARLARSLATALTTGDFSTVPMNGASPESAAAYREATFREMQPYAPEVRAGQIHEVVREPSTATADLTYTWGIDGAAWTYITTANLVRLDGAWQVRWSPDLLAPDLVEAEQLVVRRIQADRADVLGEGDTTLVTARPVHRVGVDKTLVPPEQVDAAARALADSLGIDAETYSAQVAAAGARAFIEAIVVREHDPDHDVPALAAIPGVRVIAGSMPLALTRAFARPVLGTTGPATAEIVEGSDGAVVAGDVVGLSGLQKQFDEQLRGTPGLSVIARAIDGAHRELFRVDPVTGQALRTTLSPDVQHAAENVVSGVEGTASAIVAIRPSTGDVLALASGPGGDGTSTATLGLYAPGSTFKVASALALLRSGMMPDSVVTCPATTLVDGREFRNYPDYPASALGSITLRTAIAESCNTALLTAADRAPQAAIAAAAEALGLTAGADLGFAASLGSVPAESTGGTDHAASLIGQARIQATPLGMATVAASVAAGHRVTPRLLPDEETAGHAAEPRQPLTDAEAESLRSMMRAVVTEGGGAFLRDVPGPEVIAKSGTAQYDGGGTDLRNHAWMIAARGDLAVAVFVETGTYGSTTAGPLLEELLRALPALA